MTYFTTYWNKDRCDQMIKCGMLGRTLTVLFGGPHQSEPSLVSAGMKAGDIVYPVRILAGELYILGSMKVQQVMSFEEYIHQNPDMFARCHFGITISSQPDPDHWLTRYPQLKFLAPTCTDDVAIGCGGVPLTVETKVPSEILVKLRYQSQRSERALKHIVDGKLTSITSIQGIYRLTEESGEMIQTLFTKPA